MLYNRYANDDFASNGFDYSCISALYYQAFEDAYNALIWGDYSKYLNSLIIDGQLYTNILHKHKYDDKKSIFNEPNAHGYLFDDKKYKRDYYIDYGKKSSDTKIKSKCMYKSFANIIMNALTLLFYGRNVKDSQSGLRAFTAHAADAINIVSRGYGVSSEFIKEISDKNLRLAEVTITTIYTPETQNKGTDAIVGLKILTKMVIDLFRI